jgi:hypothetical protein
MRVLVLICYSTVVPTLKHDPTRLEYDTEVNGSVIIQLTVGPAYLFRLSSTKETPINGMFLNTFELSMRCGTENLWLTIALEKQLSTH